MILTLDTLPEALILEVCNHLEIFSLVAFSETNRNIRYLSNTRSSFWLQSLARSSLFLPLPTHRPLHSFSAKQLNVAAHRAIISERNITSTKPRLQSSRYISWPYEPASGIEEEAASVAWEVPEAAIHMHLSHPNAEWMFTVSSNNILRILHLRSGKLALAYGDDAYEEKDRGALNKVAWAVEFREEEKASLVMNCHVLQDEQWWPAIRLFNIHFKSEECVATMELIGTRIMPEMAAHLDIAGGYIVAVETGTRPYDAGKVHMIRWRDMKEIALPPIYPSVRIAAFQEYFVTVGLSPFRKVTAQIVGFPDESSADIETVPETLEDTSTTKLNGGDRRPSRLSIHSYELDFRGTILDKYGYPFACQICHFYTGSRESPIKIWLRPGRKGIWSVFTVDLDLLELKSSALRFNTGKAFEGESLTRNFPIKEGQCRVFLEETLRHWSAPVASGRRFIWWRPKDLRTGAATEPEENTEIESIEFRLFVAIIDDLAPLAEVEKEALDSKFLLDYAGTYAKGSAASKQLAAAREMEVPKALSVDKSRIYMFVMEEWSGTILVQMYDGGLWVLRYGKA